MYHAEVILSFRLSFWDFHFFAVGLDLSDMDLFLNCSGSISRWFSRDLQNISEVLQSEDFLEFLFVFILPCNEY